jgi:hypothetical protein
MTEDEVQEFEDAQRAVYRRAIILAAGPATKRVPPGRLTQAANAAYLLALGDVIIALCECFPDPVDVGVSAAEHIVSTLEFQTGQDRDGPDRRMHSE